MVTTGITFGRFLLAIQHDARPEFAAIPARILLPGPCRLDPTGIAGEPVFPLRSITRSPAFQRLLQRPLRLGLVREVQGANGRSVEHKTELHDDQRPVERLL